MEQELSRFAHRAHEQEQADPGQCMRLVEMHAKQGDNRISALGTFSRKIVCRTCKNRLERGRAEQHEQAENSEKEAKITDTVDDERLHRSGVGGWLLVPEADQQVGRNADAFPAEEHLQEIVRRHQHQHGEGEERQIGKEPRTVRIVMHVADRIDMNQARNGVDHHQHDCRQRINAQCPVNAERTRIHPPHDRNANRLAIAHGDGKEGHPRQQCRDDQEQRCDIFRRLGADATTTEAGDQRTDERKKDDSLVHGSLSPSSC